MAKPVRHLLTAAELAEWLSYDPVAGQFTWVQCASNRAPVGSVARCVDGKGYICIRLHGQLYRAHRLAWLAMTGTWPPDLIDHENRVPADNRWENLRLATGTQNGANKSSPTRVSGLKGVSWAANRGLWFARIKTGGRAQFLGYFDDKHAAHAVYRQAASKAFGKYARFE